MRISCKRELFCVFALVGLAGCANSNQKPAIYLTSAESVLFGPRDTTELQQVGFDTLPTNNSVRDRIIPGPSTRIALSKPDFFAEAWRAVGAQGNPPRVDFAKNTVVLVGTDTYGSGDMNVAVDSVFRVGQRLYVIVQEYSNGAMIDVSSRGTIALAVHGLFDPASVSFIARPPGKRPTH